MFDHLRRVGRSIAIVLVAVVAATTLGAGTARAARGGNPGPNDRGFNPGSDARSNHCTAPAPIGDLNAFYGVSWQIVTGSGFCGPVASGEFWTPAALWGVNTTFASTPQGFVPAGATPLEDFVAKFVAVKYVVDPGSRQARTSVVPKSSRLWTGQFFGQPTVNTVTLGPVQPARPGQHVVEVYWVLNGLHCDGLGNVVAENCLPAGETLLYTIPFNVTAPAP